ncbi:MAG: 6-carboxyhexanoate--CoA ligase [Thermotaleaceae bacterium]
MKEELYSIKMRASKGEKHISGAERMIIEKEIGILVQQLSQRAMDHSKGKPDFINISIQNIGHRGVEYIYPLSITTIEVEDYFKGRACAIEALKRSGLSQKTSQIVLATLRACYGMRGAILLDIHSLERLEPNRERGIRVTNLDWDYRIREELEEALEETGLNNEHVKEALALASKVCNAPGIVAELCWSDDPDYTAGYVASKAIGYMRITQLKSLGDDMGGRVFCFDSSKASIEDCIEYLQGQAILVQGIPKIKNKISYERFMEA